jgi:hypothetical protein
MKTIVEKITEQASLKTLPEFSLIKKNYPKNAWLIMGTLTHAKPTSAATQLLHFHELMDALGKSNDVFGKRLHWVVRVGGGEGTNTHTHLHFLLAEHKITNGHTIKFTAEQVIQAIKKHWAGHGMEAHQKIERFDPSKNGLAYIFRDESRDQERIVEMSSALRSLIKKRQQSSTDYWDRDPLAVEIVDALLAKDPNALVGFGDQMASLHSRAAA